MILVCFKTFNPKLFFCLWIFFNLQSKIQVFFLQSVRVDYLKSDFFFKDYIFYGNNSRLGRIHGHGVKRFYCAGFFNTRQLVFLLRFLYFLFSSAFSQFFFRVPGSSGAISLWVWLPLSLCRKAWVISVWMYSILFMIREIRRFGCCGIPLLFIGFVFIWFTLFWQYWGFLGCGFAKRRKKFSFVGQFWKIDPTLNTKVWKNGKQLKLLEKWIKRRYTSQMRRKTEPEDRKLSWFGAERQRLLYPRFTWALAIKFVPTKQIFL